MSRAALCLAAFSLLLLLEALWVGLGPRWFESAREWAGPAPAIHMTQLIVGSCAFSWVSWNLHQGRRWAWVVARAWALVMGPLGGAVVLGTGVAGFVGGPDSPASVLLRHPVEIALGTAMVACLTACAVLLSSTGTAVARSRIAPPKAP